ncbi:MAG TPA: methyltransferase domain-containing protein [Solirubrobacteraceae bacterium]|jgi:SAM-dependent methyltransferase|nr:methyltransferase domain-containing protein [Solirubrobacteraceae bacterium]
MEAASDLYTQEYFDGLRWRVDSSVAAVVPAIIELFAPSSALDLGCGDGRWTLALAGRGVRTRGIDTAGVSRDEHPLATFEYGDLTAAAPGAYGRADVCLCLEVVEHLHEGDADAVVALIASCSDVVIFSAATPGQGGTGHLNEQLHEFWIGRFAQSGFVADPEWRGTFAGNDQIAPWYRANMIVFTRPIGES